MTNHNLSYPGQVVRNFLRKAKYCAFFLVLKLIKFFFCSFFKKLNPEGLAIQTSLPLFVVV